MGKNVGQIGRDGDIKKSTGWNENLGGIFGKEQVEKCLKEMGQN
jgi:hypothetical protein